MVDDRRKRVLQALVEEYIVSATPVGSRTLVDRYELGCSPATVRNELSILEETGFLVQPHISAGRVPTDFGYRSFVDKILETQQEELDNQMREEVSVCASELDELVRETSAALTRLTSCLAVVLTPSISSVIIRRISVVLMAPSRILFVLVTSDGRVINRNTELEFMVDSSQVYEVEKTLNELCVDKQAHEIREMYTTVRNSLIGKNELLQKSLSEIIACLLEDTADRVRHQGTSSLLSQPEFAESEQVAPLLRTLENQLTLLEEFSDTFEADETIVRIGHENRNADLGHVSIVAAPYGDSTNEGFIAVLGPTRMNYSRAISAVRAVSEALNDALR